MAQDQHRDQHRDQHQDRAPLCRLLVDVRGLEQRPIDALRVLVTADVLARIRERSGGDQVLAVLEDRGAAAVRSAWSGALQIRDPLASARDPEEALECLLGRPDLVVGPADPATPATRAARPSPGRQHRRLGVGTTRLSPSLAATFAVSGPADDRDPLSLRLALLRFRCAAPAEVSIARLHRAEETLERWQIKVAGWADMPPGPMPPGHAEEVRRALHADATDGTVGPVGVVGDGPDTPAVLTSLHRLEIDPRLPSGSKYQAFAQADRVLALQLGRLVRPAIPGRSA
ncbi:MAG: hypothetical protein QM638_12040 [Nocardioides sp.]|uniref:hypothetical protein n=1 Tax=Nocardioides sp. TaxID=35761 RepID=UPI0039E27176